MIRIKGRKHKNPTDAEFLRKVQIIKKINPNNDIYYGIKYNNVIIGAALLSSNYDL